MTSKKNEPTYFHNNQPVLVKIGTIMGQDLYVNLKGDVQGREHDYIAIMSVLASMFTAAKPEEKKIWLQKK